jgi:hypothetical protein
MDRWRGICDGVVRQIVSQSLEALMERGHRPCHTVPGRSRWDRPGYGVATAHECGGEKVGPFTTTMPTIANGT